MSGAYIGGSFTSRAGIFLAWVNEGSRSLGRGGSRRTPPRSLDNAFECGIYGLSHDGQKTKSGVELALVFPERSRAEREFSRPEPGVLAPLEITVLSNFGRRLGGAAKPGWSR